MVRLDLCNYSDTYIVIKGKIAVEGTNDANKRKNPSLKIMLHLYHAYQKPITHL